MKLKIHPLAEMIPAMSEEEYRDLREDIKENGQAEPITLYRGEVLDGRHRSRACEELQIQPLIREYTGDQPAAYVLSLNVKRRSLSKAQLAVIAVDFLPALEAEAKKRQGRRTDLTSESIDTEVEEPTRKNSRSYQEAAEAVGGISEALVGRAKRVKAADPEEFERLRRDETTVVNGHHRRALAQRHGHGRDEVICELLRDCTRSELHKIFLQVNDSRGSSHAEKFMHRVGLGEPLALAIMAVLEQEGFSVSITPKGPPNTLHSTSTLEWISRGGDAFLQKKRGPGPHRGPLVLALAAYRKLTPGDRPIGPEGFLLKGLGGLFLRYPEIDQDRLLDRLEAKYESTPKLLAAAKQAKDDYRLPNGHEAFGFVARYAYNGTRQGKHTLPEWRS